MKRKSKPSGKNVWSQRIVSPWRAIGLCALLLLSLIIPAGAQHGSYALAGEKNDSTSALPPVVPLTPVTPRPAHSFEVVPLSPVTPIPTYPLIVVPLTPVTPTPSVKATPQPTRAAADWVLSIDDNTSFSFDGVTQRVNLYVSLNKEGGRDVTGAYTGKILYTCVVDEADLAREIESNTDDTFVSGYLSHTMEAVSATIEVVPFNAQKYGVLWGGAPVRADYMAIAAVDLTMRIQSHVITQSYMGEGEGWGSDEEIIIPAEICFLITGGQVKAYIGVHPDEYAFSGTLIGTLR